MNYAVIKTGGKQYRVSEGDIIEVDRLLASPAGGPSEKDSVVTFNEVLLLVKEDEVKIGNPTVPNISVKAQVVEQKKGEKIRVAKFKAKVGYRRVMGFRPLLTRVKIEKIEAGKAEKLSTGKSV